MFAADSVSIRSGPSVPLHHSNHLCWPWWLMCVYDRNPHSSGISDLGNHSLLGQGSLHLSSHSHHVLREKQEVPKRTTQGQRVFLSASVMSRLSPLFLQIRSRWRTHFFWMSPGLKEPTVGTSRQEPGVHCDPWTSGEEGF